MDNPYSHFLSIRPIGSQVDDSVGLKIWVFSHLVGDISSRNVITPQVDRLKAEGF